MKITQDQIERAKIAREKMGLLTAEYISFFKPGETHIPFDDPRTPLLHENNRKSTALIPVLWLSFYEVFPHLPCIVDLNDHGRWAVMTHVTLHKRKRWGGVEVAVFHVDIERKNESPWYKVENTLYEFTSRSVSVLREQAENWGYTYRNHDEKDALVQKSYEPAVKSGVYLINYGAN